MNDDWEKLKNTAFKALDIYDERLDNGDKAAAEKIPSLLAQVRLILESMSGINTDDNAAERLVREQMMEIQRGLEAEIN